MDMMVTEKRSYNPLLLGQDIKELARLERKRQLEQQRKQRIFDTKNRLIGIDIDTLEKQKQEKTDRERYEKLEHEKHALLASRIAQIAVDEEVRAERDKRTIRKAIDDFRMIHQKKEFSRDYDLEKPRCPNSWKVGRDDERFGVTVFEGEDDNLKERLKQQKIQLKTWLQQQIEERNCIEAQQRNCDKLHEETYEERDKKLMELERMENECRDRVERANAEYNAAIAKKKAHIMLEESRKESQWNDQEVLNTLTSDLMQENPDLARSALGPHRINPMMYKGMSEAAIKEIRATQLKQIREKEALRIKELHKTKSWDRYHDLVYDVTSRAEAEKDKKLQNERKELELFNGMLEKRQREVENYRNKVLYANQITDDFFGHFNKESR